MKQKRHSVEQVNGKLRQADVELHPLSHRPSSKLAPVSRKTAFVQVRSGAPGPAPPGLRPLQNRGFLLRGEFRWRPVAIHNGGLRYPVLHRLSTNSTELHRPFSTGR